MDAQMDHVTLSVHDGFDRLQRILVSMRIGDEIHPASAAEETGLSEDVCRAVLSGLERAGLMAHESEDRFVRRPLDVMNT
jgi:hypothetical protein